MLIYKITNLINKKIYIGLTTQKLSDRFYQHKYYAGKYNRPLYIAMHEYGVENFTIEEIDRTDNIETLGLLEKAYIRDYGSQNPDIGYNISAGGESFSYEDNPKAKLKLEDVVQIREIYYMGELRCKECWKMYESKISFSAFQKVWEGITWKGILSEVYTSENILLHSKQTCNYGEDNGNAYMSNDEVMICRKYYVSHTLEETYSKFGEKFKSINGFRSMLTKSYPHLPKYSKVRRKWTLNDKVIDINEYNPVSTISVSGE